MIILSLWRFKTASHPHTLVFLSIFTVFNQIKAQHNHYTVEKDEYWMHEL